MKKLFLPFIFCFGLLALHAQDEAIFSHYTVTPVIVNPAAAGFDDAHQLQMNIRSQWASFPNAPRTYGIMYNGPIGNTLGLGVGLISETAAQLTRYRGVLNYAFRYELKDIKFAAGFSTELENVSVTSSVYQSDLYEVGDAIIEDWVQGVNTFDASIAGFMKYKERTTVGISFPNLVTARLGGVPGDPQTSSSPFQYLTLYAAHELPFDQYNFSFEPSMMLRRAANAPFMLDINAISRFLDEKLIAGLTYRVGTGGALAVMLGTKVSAFQIFYAYDVSFGQFQQYNSGSHEITLAFTFENKNPRRR